MRDLVDSISRHVGLTFEALAVLIAFATTGFVVAVVIAFFGRRLGSPEQPRLLGAVLRRCNKVLHVLLPVIGMTIAMSGIQAESGLAVLLPRTLSVLSIALTGWLAINAIRGTIDYVVDTHSMQHSDNLVARQVQTQFRLLGRIVIFVVVIATIAAVLVSIPSIRNIGVSLFASAGIAGLAVGLAARPALSNLIAGVQIAITQPIRLEDVVVVEGEWGWIEEITMTFVVVRIWDLRRLVLPISYFIDKPFQNWTRTRADILGSVVLYMDYSVPLDEVRAEFSRALRELDTWDGKVEVVHVTDCTEKSMQIRLLMSAGSSPDAWELRCAVRERLIAYLQQNHPEALPKHRLETDSAEAATA